MTFSYVYTYISILILIYNLFSSYTPLIILFVPFLSCWFPSSPPPLLLCYPMSLIGVAWLNLKTGYLRSPGSVPVATPLRKISPPSPAAINCQQLQQLFRESWGLRKALFPASQSASVGLKGEAACLHIGLTLTLWPDLIWTYVLSEVSVCGRTHIQQWSHRIIRKFKNFQAQQHRCRHNVSAQDIACVLRDAGSEKLATTGESYKSIEHQLQQGQCIQQ